MTDFQRFRDEPDYRTGYFIAVRHRKEEVEAIRRRTAMHEGYLAGRRTMNQFFHQGYRRWLLDGPGSGERGPGKNAPTIIQHPYELGRCLVVPPGHPLKGRRSS